MLASAGAEPAATIQHRYDEADAWICGGHAGIRAQVQSLRARCIQRLELFADGFRAEQSPATVRPIGARSPERLVVEYRRRSPRQSLPDRRAVR